MRNKGVVWCRITIQRTEKCTPTKTMSPTSKPSTKKELEALKELNEQKQADLAKKRKAIDDEYIATRRALIQTLSEAATKRRQLKAEVDGDEAKLKEEMEVWEEQWDDCLIKGWKHACHNKADRHMKKRKITLEECVECKERVFREWLEENESLVLDHPRNWPCEKGPTITRRRNELDQMMVDMEMSWDDFMHAKSCAVKKVFAKRGWTFSRPET